MNAAYVNPFIQGAQSVLNTMAHESPALGQVFLKNKPYSSLPVTVEISIIGDIKGEVVYNMKESDACFIASCMMMGMPVAALDEMSQSAVSELANMISGNVATLFFGKGIKIDISPPRFKMNAVAADFPVVSETDKVVCVPLKFSAGHVFEIDIAFP